MNKNISQEIINLTNFSFYQLKIELNKSKDPKKKYIIKIACNHFSYS